MSDLSVRLSGNISAYLVGENPCATMPVVQPDVHLIESIVRQTVHAPSWIPISTTQPIELNQQYRITENYQLLHLELPIGSENNQLIFYVESLAGLRLMQPEGMQVELGDKVTTKGITGAIQSTAIGDAIGLIWLNGKWRKTMIQGNWEVF